ncbi:hypothetical protein [Marinimicrococcus flavescens]|uniref:Pectate lyase n=1 Tax=Marinimicrococcus flavescens TaxID=3031815 RepID=A0AAP3XQZ6_9PROT|nr:hypothetical protein [Marinimicrococcus flavescens]
MKPALLAACAALLASPAAGAALPAFPGAEGFGAVALGGRGGVVHHVTTLADGGPGSLRACVESSGPRVCVFLVGGTITLEDELAVEEPRLTIAGQTAPGGGIQLRLSAQSKHSLLRISTHDVVVRHLRLRRGASSLETFPKGVCCGDTLALRDARAVILDHLSIAYATDENVEISNTRDVTIQNSIIAWGLRFSSSADTVRDPKQHHSMGILVRDGSDRVSLLGNLLAFNLNRNPRLASGLTDFRGNTVFGASANPVTADGDATANIVGNSFDPRPLGNYRFIVKTGDRAAVHAADNETPVAIFAEGSRAAERPFLLPYELPVAAAQARSRVLEGAGALPRDSLDAAIVQHARSGSGALVDDPVEAGGWPVLDSGEPWPDHDRDGMDDRWERTNGLSPRHPSDGAKADGTDGYTNLERFLNAMAQPQ